MCSPCITASVPGAKEDDYKVDEELNKLIVEESELQQRDEARQLARQLEQGQQTAEESGIGAVSFVSCATGSDHPKDIDNEDQSQSKPLPVFSIFFVGHVFLSKKKYIVSNE